jgi:epoxyqueuosine reductase
MMQKSDFSKKTKKFAAEVGFDLVGITSAEPLANAADLESRLMPELVGEMTFLRRNPEKRCNPSSLLKNARSVICVALSYFHGCNMDFGNTRAATYALAPDYHVVIRQKLKLLVRKMETALGKKFYSRICVDSAPILEKALAARAGLGWVGKNGLLINRDFGSWLVLGEMLTDLELAFDSPCENACGDCSACLEACPTEAFSEPGMLVPARCISYLTIEHKGGIPVSLASHMGKWIFGCDECQLACSWNRSARTGGCRDFLPLIKPENLSVEAIRSMNENEFDSIFDGTVFQRTGLDRLKRNARIVRKNIERKS